MPGRCKKPPVCRSDSQAVSEALTVTIPRLQAENAKLLTRVSELEGRCQQLREQLWDMGVEGDLT
jgi:hypothetical protein